MHRGDGHTAVQGQREKYRRRILLLLLHPVLGGTKQYCCVLPSTAVLLYSFATIPEQLELPNHRYRRKEYLSSGTCRMMWMMSVGKTEERDDYYGNIACYMLPHNYIRVLVFIRGVSYPWSTMQPAGYNRNQRGMKASHPRDVILRIVAGCALLQTCLLCVCV